jgi:hypothetical protein
VVKLHVSKPWSWWWCTRDDQMVTMDPDVEDDREPRHPDTGLNWRAIARAVRSAVDVPLTRAEQLVASRWLGDGWTAVCGDFYPNLLLADGRHRLWEAGKVDPGPWPIQSSHLLYVDDALDGFDDDGQFAEVCRTMLVEMRHGWSARRDRSRMWGTRQARATRSARRLNTQHLQNINGCLHLLDEYSASTAGDLKD